MEKLSLEASNVYTEAYQSELETFVNSKLSERLTEKYRVKPYHEENRNLYFSALCCSYVFNMLSLLTSALYIYPTLKAYLGTLFSIIISFTILAILELFKRLILPQIIKNYLQFKKLYIFRLCLALLLLFCSACMSYLGGDNLSHGFSSKPSLVSLDSISQVYQKQLDLKERMQLSLLEVKYRGSTTRKAQRAINSLQDEILKLREAAHSELKEARITNDSILHAHNKTLGFNAWLFAIVALCFDCSLLFCLAYVEHYDYKSFLQFATIPTATVQQLPNDKGNTSNTPNNDDLKTVSSVSTETVTEGNSRECLHCSKPLNTTNKRKKYCSTKCRIAAWEERNNRKLRVPST